MPRAGLTPEKIVHIAVALVDDGEPLTLAAVASRAGVAPPSLYKHISGLDELHTLIAAQCLDEMTAAFSRAIAGRSGEDAVRGLMTAYRQYVRDHPQRYAAIPADPLSQSVVRDSGSRMLKTCSDALRAYRLEGAELVHQLRLLRSAAHGFASLEASGGFGLPEDVDASYRRLIDLLILDLTQKTDTS